jgi:hypothetical protein
MQRDALRACACKADTPQEKVSEVSAASAARTLRLSFRTDSRSFILRKADMPICHDHNLARPLPKQLPFGIRVKLRSTDPFKNLVGSDWTKEHWFATREERDRALKEMSGRYVYFRPGDQPTLEYEKIER